MGRGQEAMEVGWGAREVALAGEELQVIGTGRSRRATGRGGWFSSFSALNNIGQSVAQAPQVVQDHLFWWPKSDGKEASLSRSSRISMHLFLLTNNLCGDFGWWRMVDLMKKFSTKESRLTGTRPG